MPPRKAKKHSPKKGEGDQIKFTDEASCVQTIIATETLDEQYMRVETAADNILNVNSRVNFYETLNVRKCKLLAELKWQTDTVQRTLKKKNTLFREWEKVAGPLQREKWTRFTELCLEAQYTTGINEEELKAMLNVDPSTMQLLHENCQQSLQGIYGDLDLSLYQEPDIYRTVDTAAIKQISKIDHGGLRSLPPKFNCNLAKILQVLDLSKEIRKHENVTLYTRPVPQRFANIEEAMKKSNLIIIPVLIHDLKEFNDLSLLWISLVKFEMKRVRENRIPVRNAYRLMHEDIHSPWNDINNRIFMWNKNTHKMDCFFFGDIIFTTHFFNKWLEEDYKECPICLEEMQDVAVRCTGCNTSMCLKHVKDMKLKACPTCRAQIRSVLS